MKNFTTFVGATCGLCFGVSSGGFLASFIILKIKQKLK